jgi:hypothetical protein
MNQRKTRTTRLLRLAAGAAVLATLAASCTTTPGGGGTSAPLQQFCDFFEEVSADPPEAEETFLVKDDVVAQAEETTVTGNECTDAGAEVEMDGALLAEGEEVPSEQGDPASEPIAAVTGDEITAGEPVLENLSVQTLSASIGPYGIRLTGNVGVTISGVTSTIGFTGTLLDLDNWSVGLSSSALTIPGITTSPVVFSGTLSSSFGVPSLSLTANATLVEVGDITVSGASISLNASPATGVQASIAGSLKIGPSTATGTVDVDFDRAGALVSANADISAHLVGYQAGGDLIDLQGTVKMRGNADETTISFTGSGVVGDLQVNEANGDLTLATNEATFVGVLDVQSGSNWLRYNGSIVWDGITAYTPFLTLEGGGEYSGTLADGQTVRAAGVVETTVVGNQLRTVLTGDFEVGTLAATGQAIIEVNGPTTALYVDGSLVGAGFDADLDGAVVITDGIAEQVQLTAAVTGEVVLGDTTLTGATLDIESSYGSPLDISFSGGLEVGTQADLTGTVDASFGPNGTLLSLVGNMNGSLTLDSWGLLNFSGSVVASPEQVTVTGSGGFSTINFPLGITFNGSLTSSLTNPSWTLNGSARFRIASIDIANARVRLESGAGARVTRGGFYFAILGIPTYFEADFHLLPGGGCSSVDITGGSLLARPLLAAALPGVVGCPVYI